MTSQPNAGQRHDRSALVLYASETGNSQDVAEELGRAVERLHFNAQVSDMDSVELNYLLRFTVIIFAVSTTGQGEFPKNSRKFWKSLLRKRLPPNCLGHVTFALFGLGDSSYPKFNWAARKLHKRLLQLGAKEIYPLGEADEQHSEGIDGTFINWAADFSKHLLSLYPLPDGLFPIPSDTLLPPKYLLELSSSEQTPNPATTKAISSEMAYLLDEIQKRRAEQGIHASDSHSGILNEQYNKDYLNGPGEGEVLTDTSAPPDDLLPIPGSFEALLTDNKRITPESHWQDVRELTLLLPEHMEYQPGDTIDIYPKNFPKDVQALIDLMDWVTVADTPLTFSATSPKYFREKSLTSLVPHLYPLENTTLRQLLTHNLDITAIPKRSFFSTIYHFTDDQMHKERLQEFSNPVYTDEFFDYATRPRRSILEVLQDFPSVKIPWTQATSIFPLIRPRTFSISSGGTLKQAPERGFQKVQLLVAIVKYRTVLRKIRQGLCSRYITSLGPNSVLKINLNRGTSFYAKIRSEPTTPLILICPGTGVAPARALIWERAALISEGRSVGRVLLFFGNRNHDADFFYSKEWMQNPLISSFLDVLTAFSRDQREKIYVQDIVRQQGSLVYRLLREGAVVVVCGSSGKMPLAVRSALVDVMMQEDAPDGSWKSREGAEGYMSLLEKEGRYIQETW
ncbi:hypothetical protein F5884DRAFT_480027 [Xylogone sp. PMI_703]|nr:hypothetical protein F5884DRAFT_480027 [Xylogone sp. PMI_703]